MEELEPLWRQAIQREDVALVEQLTREILLEHQHSPLACELRYQRGTLALTEGEGIGQQRLNRAMVEFNAGIEAGERSGPAAEPWRSLNKSMRASCLARVGNLDGATEELVALTREYPKSITGFGALCLLERLWAEEKPEDAKRYANQRISYARALVRQTKDTNEFHSMRFLLAQQLLDNAQYRTEGINLLESLSQEAPETLGEELQQEVLQHLTSLES
jgi:hypothetical protein